MNKEKLRSFVKRIENFHKFSHGKKIVIFGYYLTNIEKHASFNHTQIRECYKLLDLNQPANISDMLSKLRSSGILIPSGDSYRVSGPESENIESEILESKPFISISKNLENLPKMLIKQESEFLKETLNCLKVKAWHAVIVLVWIITIDHLQDYVINKNLIMFNQILQGNHLYKNVNIGKKADFEKIKDSDFIAVLRTAGWIDSSQMKILEGKLDIRNSYAHPSTLVLTESMAISFIEDLILNVVLKIN